MKVHNVRSPKQWEIISKRIDFRDKIILDLGCGKGDILNFANQAGAEWCYGIDLDLSLEEMALLRSSELPNITFIKADINTLILQYPPFRVDIAICFSVLPYLAYPRLALKWLKDSANISFIECQYFGDGPGPKWLKNSDDMRNFLLNTFDRVEPIGSTLVEGRNKERDIWLCQ